MLRRLFASRKRRAPISRRFVRLHLEQLEKREVLDASLVQGLGFLTLNAYQAAQQSQQLQVATQTDLSHFQQDAASFTAGKGVTIAQLNQDIATLKQDVNNIQGLNSVFQRDEQFFLMGLMANTSSVSNNDAGMLLLDTYFLQTGQSLVGSALQTAGQASSVTLPDQPLLTPMAQSTVKTDPATPKTAPATTTSSSTTTDSQLVTLTLNPLNVNLLGLNVQTNQIQINIAAQQGNGDLLGNLLGDTSNLLNLPAVSAVVNNVLGNVVTLLNSGTLSVAGVTTNSGPLSSPAPGSTSTTSVLTLHVAPVTLNLIGAEVTTSPIDLTLTAQSGQGLVLGNVVSDLANLFN
ncbi:MAG TPA: hypothetical protein VH682_19660, partial [Gemmataceae bacterium]